jgi:aspartate carbamoyltransferase catalytic subunit
MGAEVTLAGPPTLIPKHIKDSFPINVTYNVKEALEWCDVANVLRIQLERQNQVLFSSLREYNQAYGITKQLLRSIQKDILIMHPGPINRGVELDSDVADSGQSIILDQVENGVAVRMAVLYLLSGRKEASA